METLNTIFFPFIIIAALVGIIYNFQSKQIDLLKVNNYNIKRRLKKLETFNKNKGQDNFTDSEILDLIIKDYRERLIKNQNTPQP